MSTVINEETLSTRQLLQCVIQSEEDYEWLQTPDRYFC